MRIQKLDESTRQNLLEDLLKRSPNHYGEYEQGVAEILAAVKEKKDEALFDYTKRFDKAEISAANIRVTKEEIEEAYEELLDLVKEEVLYSKDLYEEIAMAGDESESYIKALCLNVVHDCNLRCKYCFAD